MQHTQVYFCRSPDGAKIAYEISGSGPPLVWSQHWLHSLESDWESPIWKPWLTFLTRRHTVVRYDWRGCGLSDRDVEFGFNRYVADLSAVIEATRLDRFALFGMAGAGSGAAMAYAGHHPDRVTRLILQECQTKGRIAGTPTPQQRQEADARLKVIEIGWMNETKAYGDFFAALHIPDASEQQMKAYNDMLRQMTSANNAVSLLRSFWTEDMAPLASAVRCPTLVVHARRDAVIPFEEGRFVASVIPQARFLALESCNHLLLSTQREWPRFVKAVEEFLAEEVREDGTRALRDLSARERDIAELLAQGLGNQKIASHLGISEKTVRNHVSTILSKLGADSRAQVVAMARDAGFGRRSISR
jgi:RNA polymerase sigma factor (sigma-70 family)